MTQVHAAKSGRVRNTPTRALSEVACRVRDFGSALNHFLRQDACVLAVNPGFYRYFTLTEPLSDRLVGDSASKEDICVAASATLNEKSGHNPKILGNILTRLGAIMKYDKEMVEAMGFGRLKAEVTAEQHERLFDYSEALETGLFEISQLAHLWQDNGSEWTLTGTDGKTYIAKREGHGISIYNSVGRLEIIKVNGNSFDEESELKCILVDVEFRGGERIPGTMRSFLRHEIARMHADPDNAVLIVSELSTNAFKYGNDRQTGVVHAVFLITKEETTMLIEHSGNGNLPSIPSLGCATNRVGAARERNNRTPGYLDDFLSLIENLWKPKRLLFSCASREELLEELQRRDIYSTVSKQHLSVFEDCGGNRYEIKYAGGRVDVYGDKKTGTLGKGLDMTVIYSRGETRRIARNVIMTTIPNSN